MSGFSSAGFFSWLVLSLISTSSLALKLGNEIGSAFTASGTTTGGGDSTGDNEILGLSEGG